jgi:hypothetical protein
MCVAFVAWQVFAEWWVPLLDSVNRSWCPVSLPGSVSQDRRSVLGLVEQRE